MRRRAFMALAAGAATTGFLRGTAAAAPPAAKLKSRLKAIAFDAFPVLDPRAVSAAVHELVPDRGAAFMVEWRTRQFEYTWLRVITRRYADFWQVTEDALRFAARKTAVSLSDANIRRLMTTYRKLNAWPDARAALESLKNSGYRLAFLSNFTPLMLEDCIGSAGLAGLFEKAISTDSARTFKPDPSAYQLAMDELQLERDEILFVAFAGWDAAGAKAFGYPTFWVNRLKEPREELGIAADGEGTSLTDMLQFLAS